MSQPAQGTPGALGYDQAGNLMNGNNNHGLFFSLILGALQTTLAAIVTALGGGGASGTYVPFHVAAGTSLSGGIPTSAKRWAVNFVNPTPASPPGTGNTFGGNTAVTAGQGFSDNASPASAITIACDASTVADGFYSTT